MAVISARASVCRRPGDSPLVAFLAILRRDIAVTGRELPHFLRR